MGSGEEVVPASEYRALQSQVRELQRLLGKKTLENPARGAGSGTAKKTTVALALLGSGRHAMKRVADALGVARSNLAVQAAAAVPRRRRGRRPQPKAELLGQPRAGLRMIARASPLARWLDDSRERKPGSH